MGDVPTGVVHVRLRLQDVWGGEDVVRELTLAELETSERGVAVGSAFYPWRRIVSYEWEILEEEPDEALQRPRQLLVRVLTHGPDGPEEHSVAADRFEVGPWTVSMILPERVDTETQRSILRRLTLPWHRVLEYERMLAEAQTAAAVPDRPDLANAPQLVEVNPADANGHVVIDVAAVERDHAVARQATSDADHASEAHAPMDDEADAQADEEVDDEADAAEPVAVGTGARVKKAVPRKTGQRRRRPRRAS